MARKAKKKYHKMPKLSFADQLIYWTIFTVLCVLYFLLLLGPLELRKRIAFADEMVIAAADRASVLWLIIPWGTFFLVTFILWVMPYQERYPIFGLRNFQYGPPGWPRIYPLFMKNKPPVWVSQREKENKRTIAVILAIVLVVSFIPFPWSLYGRDCLRSDGGISRYNIFNAQTRDYSPGDIAEVEFDTFRYSTGKYSPTKYGVKVTLTTDSGKRFSFDSRDFRKDGDRAYWLVAMTQLMRRFDPSIVTCTGTGRLSAVIADQALNAEQAQMLYRLFGLNE